MKPVASFPLRPSPLAELNAHLAQASEAARASVALGSDTAENGRWPDLRSAQRFRDTWERLSAEQTVAQAAHRAPDNAGPLNAHRLVLRTLDLMAGLSPHYLRRFLAHTETLLWLDQALAELKQPVRKPVKAVRQKK